MYLNPKIQIIPNPRTLKLKNSNIKQYKIDPRYINVFQSKKSKLSQVPKN